MTRVVVPVRYPLSNRSRQTLERAVDIARERDGELTVLHIDLYQDGRQVNRLDLKRAVESAVGPLDFARYVVRKGFLVEESILEEVAAEGADVVVIGNRQVGRWRRMIRRLMDEPDIETYLKDRLECDLVTVAVD